MSTGNGKIVGLSFGRTASWGDSVRLIPELLIRNLYWRSAALRRWRDRKIRRRRPAIQECHREDLRTHLGSIGVTAGALILVHTRVSGVRIRCGGSVVENDFVKVSEMLLSDLLDLLGPSGTLVMPTNARYQRQVLEGRRSLEEVITYDPTTTPCSVGLTNEYFWRERGAKRSLFPHNMLAASGPLANDLLRDNLNERKPSPHGVDSGYYRICQRNGLMVSIGLPLCECMTLAHVVEEVRPDWPIKDFFTERCYRVLEGGAVREWTVRLPREEYAKYCWCRRRMARDLLGEGIVHEGGVGTLRVDWASAKEIYDFFWRKTDKQPYPYFGLWLGRIK